MKFWKIKNLADDKAEISIYGDIVDDSWKGFSWGEDISIYPTDIKNLLDGVKGKDLTVRINSGGGDVFAGFAIANMIARHKGHTHAIIDGLCASIATQIALACQTVEMPENAYFMVHRPTGVCVGTSADMLHRAQLLDKLQDSIEEVYLNKARGGVTADRIHDMVEQETWLNGKEAAEVFDISVTSPVCAAACVGEYAAQLKNRPESLKVIDQAKKEQKETEQKEKEQKEKERAAAEIAVALALSE